jgi:hypothetical protein
MINKIILFGDFSSRDWDDFWNNDHVFLKTSSLLRLGNALMKEGFDVKEIHHCTSFNKAELDHILETFSQGEKVLICISSSFLSSTNRLDYALHADESKRNIHQVGGFWGKHSFAFLKNIGILSKKYKFPVVIGGFDIQSYKFKNATDVRAWGFEVLNLFVDYYIVGYSHDVIVDFCRDKPLKPIRIKYDENKYVNVLRTGEVTDWEDHAFTPVPGTHIAQGESLITQIAGGCISVSYTHLTLPTSP